jgi:hypothetical protein
MSLILRIRSEVLKRNLEEIRQKVDQPPFGKRFTELGAACITSKELLPKIQRELFELRCDAQADTISPSDFLGKIQAIESSYATLFKNVQDICNEARRLSEASVFNMRVKARPVVGREVARQLGSILTELDRTQPNLGEAWKTYQAQYAEAQSLLSEYLEFIGGLALRDAGFDDGMCNYADKLIALVSGSTSSSVAIPARQETIRMTWGRIVRMGCPEWTLWALPLTAHDVWYTAAQDNLKTENIKDFTGEERWVQECLADAYAVWSTGPAYAYAAFFLRLDPFCVGEDREGCTHDLRAHAILKMWELMDKADGGNLPYLDVRSKLRDQWLDALAYAPTQRQIDGDGNPDFPVDKEKMKQLDELIATQFDALHQYGSGGFSAQNWRSIQDWPERLRNGQPIEHPEADFRWVLNAAWVARIEKPEKTSVIQEGAAKVWEGITKRINRGGDSGDLPHQKPGRY